MGEDCQPCQNCQKSPRLKNPTFSPQIVADKRRSGKQSAEKQKIQRLILLSRLD